MQKMNMSVEDLMADERFKSWVLNPTEEGTEYWLEWSGKSSERKETLRRAKAVMLGFKFNHASIVDTKMEEGLLRLLNRPTVKKKAFGFASSTYWKIAAMLVLMLSVSFYALRNNYDVEETKEFIVKSNPNGVKTTVKLPDGTSVRLNANSSISYAAGFSDSLRTVLLTGEAYFEVAKNEKKAFVVETSGVRVRAVGTAFDINAFQENEVNIYLTEGLVAISSQNEKGEQSLKQGEMSTVDPISGESHISVFNTDEILAWTQNEILFKNSSFDEVITVLTRWYGVDFVLVNRERAGQWRYTSKFKDKTLTEVLKVIAQTKNFTFNIIDQKVTITF